MRVPLIHNPISNHENEFVEVAWVDGGSIAANFRGFVRF